MVSQRLRPRLYETLYRELREAAQRAASDVYLNTQPVERARRNSPVLALTGTQTSDGHDGFESVEPRCVQAIHAFCGILRPHPFSKTLTVQGGTR